MIGFVCTATFCFLSGLPPNMRGIESMSHYDITMGARHCTDWTKKTVRPKGLNYNRREWNGWLKLSGTSLPEERAPMSELVKIRAGWMVEFANNNRYNGRHAGIVTKVLAHGTEGITAEVISFDGRSSVNLDIYRFVSRESGRNNLEKNARVGVPIIATYKPR